MNCEAKFVGEGLGVDAQAFVLVQLLELVERIASVIPRAAVLVERAVGEQRVPDDRAPLSRAMSLGYVEIAGQLRNAAPHAAHRAARTP